MCSREILLGTGYRPRNARDQHELSQDERHRRHVLFEGSESVRSADRQTTVVHW